MSFAGCGPSKQDLMMRAAKRVRQKSDPNENKPEPPINAATVAPVAKTVESPVTVPSGRAAKPEATVEKTDDEVIEKKPLLTVEELRPEQPLSEAERRKWAYENLVAVGEAIKAYQDERGYLIPRYMKGRGGLTTVSWRVLLLPYLGYDELYKKFDLNKPWYMEPNKSLLKYIPKEYVSPERFDTMTNLQLPSTPDFTYHKLAGAFSSVEDGFHNTIALVEVNDTAAVEWAAPLDFEPKSREELHSSLGSLRGDGAFALWGNGWPTLLAKSHSPTLLWTAFTAAGSDGNSLGKLHRPITIEGVTEGAVAAKPEEPTGSSSVTVQNQVPAIEQVQAVREEAPTGLEIRNASERLRKVFAEELGKANTDGKLNRLCERLISSASRIKSEPADAYALTVAAQNLAIKAGNAELLLHALDLRVGRFEIDAYEQNMDALMKFSQGTARRDPVTIDGKVKYIRRALHTIYAAITQNDFMRGSKLARTANKYLSDSEESDLPKLFARLRSQLGGAAIEFDSAKEHLATIRINPDNDAAVSNFGYFLCFFKGDWQTGLEMITRSKNLELAELAEADLAGPETVDDQIAVADRWWSIAERARGVYKQGAMDRAKLYYQMAFEVMPDSLERMHVKNQLLEVRNEDPSSPFALCERLANEMNADLQVSLAALAVARYEGRQDDGDDEDDG
ncbi:MAG: DUF1559 domain-containing protein [Planctomycetota bacterium]